MRPIEDAEIHKNFKLKAECAQGNLNNLNKSACDSIVQTEHYFRDKVATDMLHKGELSGIKDRDFLQLSQNEWETRNKGMAKNICEFAKSTSFKCIVVIIGFEHRYILAFVKRMYCP